MKKILILASAIIASSSHALTLFDGFDSDNTSHILGSNGIVTDQLYHVGAGGNPGGHMRNDYQATGPGSGDFYNWVFSNSMVYTPTGSPVLIDFSFDQYQGYGPGGSTWTMSPWTFGYLLAEQDGFLYFVQSDVQAGAPETLIEQWITHSRSGVTAGMFGTSNSGPGLDLSNGASDITFGFYSGGGFNMPSATTIEGYHLWDNFEVEVEAVPEPASLVVIALSGLLLSRKRTKSTSK